MTKKIAWGENYWRGLQPETRLDFLLRSVQSIRTPSIMISPRFSSLLHCLGEGGQKVDSLGISILLGNSITAFPRSFQALLYLLAPLSGCLERQRREGKTFFGFNERESHPESIGTVSFSLCQRRPRSNPRLSRVPNKYQHQPILILS